MTQDKRDKNDADRAQSSAKPEDNSQSSGSKPSEAAPKTASAAGDKPATDNKAAPSDAGRGQSEAGSGASGGESNKPGGQGAPGQKSASSPGAGAGASASAKPSGGAKETAKTGGDSRQDADRGKAKSTSAGSTATAGSGTKSSGAASAGASPRSGAPGTRGGATSGSGRNAAASSGGAGRGAASTAGGTRGPGGTKRDGKRRNIGLLLAVFALIIAIVAAACTGYLWYRGQQRIGDLDSRINTVDNSLQHNVQKVIMPKLSDMHDKLSDMHDRLHKFSQRTDQLSQKLDQRQQQIAQLQQTIQHVQAQNKQLSNQLGGDHSRFVDQRIALLLEAANQRLQIEHDPKGAARALSLADDAIQRSGDPELHPVRAQIASEKAALKALPNPDIEGLSLKLSNAIQQVPKLPLKSHVPSHYQPKSGHGGAASAGAQGGKGGDNGGTLEFAGIKLARMWHQFVDSAGNALSRMVTIRHANGTENAPALMAPDQSYFLVQNLQLQLRTARLALLGGNAQTYHDALSQARDWIRKYFDTSDSSVSAVLNDLSQLSQVKLNWQAPDLSSSLKTLRRIMARDQNNQNNGNGASSAGGSASGQSAGAGSSGGGAAQPGQAGSGSKQGNKNANAAGSS
ncbi:uroporphyrinogen-III C-methyltransferase [Salinisphaera sp. LB1]|uniref:uroporphyrinogen-III C-methyltransferase n=1 Tax=Salinisphaera sp. LB1 TaxID=2183911 RepID=UPI000D705082|nr:uroporphyrinogen-III C-methyltransferase [Salinisphaera sp. LB1]AWN14820.1 PE-PGRS virulence associated protein [Salinisphaera sp. LB1]